MKIKSIRKYQEKERIILTADIESDSLPGTSEIFFAYPVEFQSYIPENADPFFPAVLIPCMMNDESLEVIPSLSKRLYENQSMIQDIFTVWFPGKFHRIKVTAGNLSERTLEREVLRNAGFFSLGVDSMYTMLKHNPEHHPLPGHELSSLVYMKGLELPLSVYSRGQDKAVSERISRVAKHYNLELIQGETNIRDIFPVNWEDHYFGPGLAAVALSLSGEFRNIYIPSCYSYSNVFPVPSSPLTDHLWSTESTAIIHDGAERERAEKIADLISTDPFALNNLRVCVDNEGGDHNCGKCWKCVRTMVSLEIAGKLKEAGSFPDKLPENYPLKLKTYQYDSMLFALENLKLAKRYGRTEIEKLISREIRLGQLDQLTQGKSRFFILAEVAQYFYHKMHRKLRGKKY